LDPVPLTLVDARFAYEPVRPVIRGLSCTFTPGRVTAIVGPNGAGKTTLLRLLLGLVSPDHGSARLDDQPVDRLAPAQRARRMAYIPQRSSVAFAYSVRQIVAMGKYAVGSSDSRSVEHALERTRMSDLADRPVHTLSAGQVQRVALARALAQLGTASDTPDHGRYLLADEPTGAMDPWHTLHTLGLLRDLALGGLGIVIVLHDLSMAARYADDVLLLDATGASPGLGPSRDVLSPESLAAVFGVAFERLDAAGGPVIMPITHPRTPPGPLRFDSSRADARPEYTP
jgi:iron complex transport system ATP-binding protein